MSVVLARLFSYFQGADVAEELNSIGHQTLTQKHSCVIFGPKGRCCRMTSIFMIVAVLGLF